MAAHGAGPGSLAAHSNAMNEPDLQTILATDCGSTTTKAILIDRRDGEFRLTARGEAPTTVEAPAEDVTRGVLNAVAEIEEQTGRRLVRDQRIWTPRAGRDGCDAYVGTSSAGGGLQMLVAGVARTITAESAARAALGAGAIVSAVLATNDGQRPHERIERLRALRPDMILLAGGTDGGAVRQVAAMSQVIAAADPRPRFGTRGRLPVVYAGNPAARDEVRRILGPRSEVRFADNLRPMLESENVRPARDCIHGLFLDHVMAQAPGYATLMSWTTAPLMPTPAAVGHMMQLAARRDNVQILGVDVGGATTDVFSVLHPVGAEQAGPPTFNRTVSANLGMSYSAFNVVAEAGLANILRWVPTRLDERDARNRIRNKMVRPTTIPQTLDDLLIEHALCREALRLAVAQHQRMAVGLQGVRRQSMMADALGVARPRPPTINMLRLDLVIGSGGVLSHSPRRVQSALLMIDAFEPEGFTELTVDSIFMMPQLGVLSTVHAEAALHVFHRDCLVRLGWCIAPARGRRAREGQPCMRVEVRAPGQASQYEIRCGQMARVPLDADQSAEVVVQPAPGFDLGRGPGKAVQRHLVGGTAGLLLDGRGRPLQLPADPAARMRKLGEWNRALDIYPQSE